MSIPTILAFTACLATADLPRDLRAWARETSDLIESRYRHAAGDGYVQTADSSGGHDSQPAFMWDLGVRLSSLAAGCRIDKRTYLPLLKRTLHSMEPYWSVANGVGGYSVLPHLGSPDRYYDDNAWVALALVEAYDVTRDKDLLQRAKDVFRFVMSGESDELGGGIFWHEQDRKSKHTCSNGPALVVALMLYRATKERNYLDTAHRLDRWAGCLRDSDGLYWDNIRLDGSIEKTKWSYNTALMIRAKCLLYQISGDRSALHQGAQSADSAVKRWSDPSTGALRDEAPFAHHLFEALLVAADAANRPDLRDAAVRAVRFLHEHGHNPSGLYGKRWDAAPADDAAHLDLKFQAAACRAYAEAAFLLRGRAQTDFESPGNAR